MTSTNGSGSDMNLTPGERFLIQRWRRHRNRRQAAKEWGVTPRRIREWELDRGHIPPPRVDLLPDRLSPTEVCCIARRRSGLTPAEIGLTLGVTGKTVLNWERGKGDSEPLINYWKARG